MTLSDLADLVQTLTEACRKTDALIYCAVNTHPMGYELQPEDDGSISVIIDGYRHQGYTAAGQFTGSFDAAMDLAVDGYYIIAIHQMPKGWIVKIGSRSNDQEPVIDVEHDSLIIALCSAWLRARASMENISTMGLHSTSSPSQS